MYTSLDQNYTDLPAGTQAFMDEEGDDGPRAPLPAPAKRVLILPGEHPLPPGTGPVPGDEERFTTMQLGRRSYALTPTPLVGASASEWIDHPVDFGFAA